MLQKTKIKKIFIVYFSLLLNSKVDRIQVVFKHTIYSMDLKNRFFRDSGHGQILVIQMNLLFYNDSEIFF